MVAERDMVEMRLREQVAALTARGHSLQQQVQQQLQQQVQPVQQVQPGESETSPPPRGVGRGECGSQVSGRGGEEAVDPIELKLRQIEDGVDEGVMSVRVRVRMCMRPHSL